jgi:hypothetical protein
LLERRVLTKTFFEEAKKDAQVVFRKIHYSEGFNSRVGISTSNDRCFGRKDVFSLNGGAGKDGDINCKACLRNNGCKTCEKIDEYDEGKTEYDMDCVREMVYGGGINQIERKSD